jgi:hypothetical protein
VTSSAYQLHQAIAGALLADALLNTDPKAARASLDAYVESQKKLGELLRP